MIRYSEGNDEASGCYGIPAEGLGMRGAKDEEPKRTFPDFRKPMSRVRLIYIAGAYTGATAEETALNIKFAECFGRLMARKGLMPVMPHMNTAGFEKKAPEIPCEFWLEGDIELMKKCGAVLFLPGRENSPGARKENHEAIKAGMGRFFVSIQLSKGGWSPGQDKAVQNFTSEVNAIQDETVQNFTSEVNAIIEAINL